MASYAFVITTLLFVTGVCCNEPEHLGCFHEDRINGYEFSSGPHIRENDNTPQLCAEFCKRPGFKYSATFHGVACMCDNSYDPAKAVSDSYCNMQCTGDSSKLCGGIYGYNIYNLTGFEPDEEPCTPGTYSRNPQDCGSYFQCGAGNINYLMQCPEGLEFSVTASVCVTPDSQWDDCDLPNYLGCFVEPSPPVHFYLSTGNWKIWHMENTPARCVNFCMQGGYPYAGLLRSYLCVCGSSYGSPLDESECRMPCSGDLALNCGGPYNNRVGVYCTNSTCT